MWPSRPLRYGGILFDIPCTSTLLARRPGSRGYESLAHHSPTGHPVDSVGSPPFYVATHHLGMSEIRPLCLLFVLAAESCRGHAVGSVLLGTNVIAATRRCRCPSRPKAPEDPELRGRRGKPRTYVRKEEVAYKLLGANVVSGESRPLVIHGQNLLRSSAVRSRSDPAPSACDFIILGRSRCTTNFFLAGLHSHGNWVSTLSGL